MPKRVVDGEALWTSRKLKNVEPEWMRGEYANLLSLALANGVFEADADQIWARVYAYLRPNIARDDVAKILTAFERAGLLFCWQDETGKRWGFWVGIAKPGRLPKLSRLKGRHERLGPDPPGEQLNQYLSGVADQGRANGSPVVSLGFGSGFGDGSGSCQSAPENGAPPAQDKPRPSPSAIPGTPKADGNRSEPPTLTFQGTHFTVSSCQDRLLAEAFPWVDRQAEYRKADSWLEANPNRRPKHTGRFLHNWFSKIPSPSNGGKGVGYGTASRNRKAGGAVASPPGKYDARKLDFKFTN